MSEEKINKIIQSRRSVRKLKGDVPDSDIYTIIDAARYAPSNGNIQPWYFVVVKDLETKQEIINLVDDFYNEEIEKQGNLKLFRAFHKNVRLKEAPIFIFAFYDTTYDHVFYKEFIRKLKDNRLEELWHEATKQSVAGAIQNTLLQAEELGYSTCIIGGLYYLKEKIEKFFGLPENYKFYSAIILGKKDEEPPILPKKPLEDILEFFPLKIEEIYQYLQENSSEIIKDHSIRVKEIAEKLQEKLGGDKKIIAYSSLLHDIALKDGFKGHAERGAKQVYEKFKRKWRKSFLDEVCYCIEHHSLFNPPLPEKLEAVCVYDADKIDFLLNANPSSSLYNVVEKSFLREESVKIYENLKGKIKW